MAIQTYSGPDLRWFAALIGLMLLRQYLNLSPLLVLLLLLLGVCLCSGRSPASSESFSPVYRPGTCAGLPWGVAAVQGRRPYMEDMFVAAPLRGAGAAGVANVAAAEGVGLTHVFAVFDGHGGKRAAQWAHDNLLSNLLAKLAAKAGELSANSSRALNGALGLASGLLVIDGRVQVEEGTRQFAQLDPSSAIAKAVELGDVGRSVTNTDAAFSVGLVVALFYIAQAVGPPSRRV